MTPIKVLFGIYFASNDNALIKMLCITSTKSVLCLKELFHVVLLWRGKSFWNVKSPQGSSWGWGKILNLRNIARPFTKHSIGNKEKTFLRHDIWHPKGALFPKYGLRLIYDPAISINGKLLSIIHQGQWQWLCARSDELVDI
jgi:hypothetical protein